MAAIAPSFRDRMKPYWGEVEGSFNDLLRRLEHCINLVAKEREAATLKFSEARGNLDRISKLLEDQWKVLQKDVEEVRAVEATLGDAYKVVAEAGNKAKQEFPLTPLSLDYPPFKSHLDTLTDKVKEVYANSLYPFLQVLRNAKEGWNPAGIVCRVCNYYSWWQVVNPETEFDREFPLNPQSKL